MRIEGNKKYKETKFSKQLTPTGTNLYAWITNLGQTENSLVKQPSILLVKVGPKKD